MRKYLFWALTGLLAVACSQPVPMAQDGTDLWLAAGRSYDEVLASVTAGIDPALPAEGYHIYDADGVRHVDGGSEAGLRYGVYALKRAEALGQAGPGLDLQEKPYYDLRLLNHWDNLDGAHPPLRRAVRVHRPERRRAEQCQFQPADPGCGAHRPRGEDRGHPPRIRCQDVPVHQMDQPHRALRPEERRPDGSEGAAVVEGQGGGDLRRDPGLRRLPGEGQFRRPGRAPTCWRRPSRPTAAS